jgi:hypothetical protein
MASNGAEEVDLYGNQNFFPTRARFPDMSRGSRNPERCHEVSGKKGIPQGEFACQC